ncbi:MAG: type II toxin-antitoxin system VapC family toxin [Victivallales bacterium]|jgi:hypothetical protein
MNGNKYFLDTNAIIQLLRGNDSIHSLLKNADFIACSIISELEYLSFRNLSKNDIELFKKFLDRIDVVDIKHSQSELKHMIVEIRKNKQLKLPDAIIIATSKFLKCKLVTADKQLSGVYEDGTVLYKIDPI